MNYKHGGACAGHVDQLHVTWRQMRNRCTSPTNRSYKNYGARGISVCLEWDDFLAFRDWAQANGYNPGLSLDRRDNDGNYGPENCRWATRKEQARNRRTSRFITAIGRTQTLAAWAEETGIAASLIASRLGRLGWPVERALGLQ